MRVILIDPERLTRDLVAQFLGDSGKFAVIACFDHPDLAAGPDAKAELILMEFGFRASGGCEAVGMVRALFPGAEIVILSGSISAAEAEAALASGAAGVISKSIPAADLLAGLQSILTGASQIVGELRPANARAELALSEPFSAREAQVANLLASGLQNKEIGAALGIAEITARLYVRQILRKLGARNRSEAVRIMTKASMADANGR